MNAVAWLFSVMNRSVVFSCLIMLQYGHVTYFLVALILSCTLGGMNGKATAWECGWLSDVPAGTPWFLNIVTYLMCGSFSSVSILFFQMVSVCVSSSAVQLGCSWSGVSMMTSWWPYAGVVV